MRFANYSRFKPTKNLQYSLRKIRVLTKKRKFVSLENKLNCIKLSKAKRNRINVYFENTLKSNSA